MLETSGGVRPAKKGAQAELHGRMVVRFKPRFVSEARAFTCRRMMVDPIINEVACPFWRELLERFQTSGFDKTVQVMQVFEPKADGMARITIRLEIRRVIGDPGSEIQSGFLSVSMRFGDRKSTRLNSSHRYISY